MKKLIFSISLLITLGLSNKSFAQDKKAPNISSFAGTYTYTKQGSFWFKVKINTDNTVLIWEAMPSDGSWGSVNCKNTYNEVSLDRETGNGKLYYNYSMEPSKASRISCYLTFSYFSSSKLLVLYIGDNSSPMVLTKGDKNPWK